MPWNDFYPAGWMIDKEDQRSSHAAADGRRRIPVVEEKLYVTTKTVDTGSIRIKKRVDEEVVEVPLVSRIHGFEIERTPLNKYVEEPPAAIRYEGRTMIISVVEEEVVTVKRLKLIEEIRLTPSEKDIVATDRVTLKKENVIIQKDPPENNDEN